MFQHECCCIFKMITLIDSNQRNYIKYTSRCSTHVKTVCCKKPSLLVVGIESNLMLLHIIQPWRHLFSKFCSESRYLFFGLPLHRKQTALAWGSPWVQPGMEMVASLLIHFQHSLVINQIFILMFSETIKQVLVSYSHSN